MTDDLISLEDAIETIAGVDITDGTEPVFSGKQVVALLKDLDTIKLEYEQIEPCEDAISRQAVLDKIKEVCFSREQEWVDFRISQGSNGQRDFIIKFIEDLPSIQPKPKTGVLDKSKSEWYDRGSLSCRCSNCGCKNNKETPYCPWCGATMEID